MAYAKKSFGQHFLTNQDIILKIIDQLKSIEIENFCEVGPGKGALSYHLLDKIPNYKLIEADKDMVAHLEQHIPKIKDHIYQHDFLKFNLKSLFEGKAFLLFGNYPYNISSQIVIRTLENSNQIPYMIGMFQKEMALRIVSSYGSKDYGPLSILSSLMYDRKILFDVNKENFSPPPNVQSAMILMKRREDRISIEFYTKFQPFVRASFQYRRKTLRNNLKGFVRNTNLLNDPYFTIRPEDVEPTKFVELYTLLMQ